MEHQNQGQDFLSLILTNWGFEDYIKVFKEQEFTEESFWSLDYNAVCILFPKLGQRTLFWKKFQQEHGIKYPSNTDFFVQQDSSLSHNSLILSNQSEKDSITSGTIHHLQNFIDTSNILDTAVGDSSIILDDNFILNCTDKTLNVQIDSNASLLKNYLSCADGKLVQLHYEKYKSLDNQTRSLLSKIIIHKEFEHQSYPNNFKLSTERFLFLRSEIVKEFPSELEFSTLYYFPYNKETRINASGKLWDVYNHFKAKLNKLSKCELSSSTLTDEIVLEEKEKLDYLEKNTADWDKIKQFWKDTYKPRNQLFLSNISVDKYLKKFPILETSKGSRLILQDFDTLYSDNTNKLFSLWPDFEQKLIKFAESKLKNSGKKNSETSTTDYQKPIAEILNFNSSCDFKGFLLLPIFFNKSSYGRNPKRKKLTTKEIESSFLYLISDGDLLNEDLEKIRDQCYVNKSTFQPSIILVGESYEKILKSYVIVNKTIYEFENVLAAVDGCFKISHALRCDYSSETKPIWMFLQKYIYKIITKYDKNFISVTTLYFELSKY